MFSFVNGLILQPLPYEQPDRLVSLQVTDAPVPIRVTPADYADWKERARVFDSLSAYTFRVHGVTSVDGSGDDDLVFGVGVSAGFFDTLRARPLLGRTLRAGEDEEGQDHVAVLSHGRWQRSFGGDPDVPGREIVLDGRPYTIVGVMPEDFDFPVEGAELWTPMVLTPALRDDRRNYTVMVVARLHDGVTLQQAQAHMEAVARQVADVQPQTDAGRNVRVIELRHQQRPYTGPFLLLGQIAALCVLLIAVANVSNLQLVRALSVRREMATRAALGADRWRLGSLVIAESLVLSIAGGAAGVAAAAWSLPPLRDSISPDVAPFVTGLRQAAVDWQVLAVSFALSVGAGLASGLSTLSRTWRSNIVDGLRPGVAGTIGGRMFLRGGLVTVQVALVVVIAVSAGQMVQALARDTRYPSISDPGGLDSPALYHPYTPGSLPMVSLRCEPACDAAVLRQRLASAHPTIRVQWARTPEADYAAALVRPRAAAALAFAGVALLAAAGGLFSLLSYAVARRRQEFGIRAALGASPAEIRRMVFRDGLIVAIAGLGAGSLFAVLLTRALSGSSTASAPAIR